MAGYILAYNIFFLKLYIFFFFNIEKTNKNVYIRCVQLT